MELLWVQYVSCSSVKQFGNNSLLVLLYRFGASMEGVWLLTVAALVGSCWNPLLVNAQG